MPYIGYSPFLYDVSIDRIQESIISSLASVGVTMYFFVNELRRKIPNFLIQAMLQIQVYLGYPFSCSLNPCAYFFFFEFKTCQRIFGGWSPCDLSLSISAV